jgi:hypothetical protein
MAGGAADSGCSDGSKAVALSRPELPSELAAGSNLWLPNGDVQTGASTAGLGQGAAGRRGGWKAKGTLGVHLLQDVQARKWPQAQGVAAGGGCETRRVSQSGGRDVGTPVGGAVAVNAGTREPGGPATYKYQEVRSISLQCLSVCLSIPPATPMGSLLAITLHVLPVILLAGSICSSDPLVAWRHVDLAALLEPPSPALEPVCLLRQVVRKKAERELLQGVDCQACKGWYQAMASWQGDKPVDAHECKHHVQGWLRCRFISCHSYFCCEQPALSCLGIRRCCKRMRKASGLPYPMNVAGVYVCVTGKCRGRCHSEFDLNAALPKDHCAAAAMGGEEP